MKPTACCLVRNVGRMSSLPTKFRRQICSRIMKRSLALNIAASLLFALAGGALFGQQQQRQLTAEQQAQMQAQQAATKADHQRMMELLKITSLRQGVSGNSQAPNAANYDESKANPFPNLPDPLVLKNGKKVTSAKQWWSQRRPEIVEDFDREIYGRMPKVTPKVKWEVIKTSSEMNGDVPVITKQVVGHVDNSSCPQITVDIRLTLTTPASAKGPVPVMMEFGFGQLPPRPASAAPPPGPPPGMSQAGPPWQQQV